MKIIIYILILSSLVISKLAYSDNELWKITAYCACEKCCGIYADGITASGKKVSKGIVANNWLEFGTKVKIKGLGNFIVEDRGSKRYFGTKQEKRKAIDVYFNSHEKAKEFGVKYLKVKIIKDKTK
jgi:3D (Asp-Asp-Asp) domain-containing protein